MIKCILLSQINYTISTIEANKNFADELQKCLVLFLWDEKPAKIKFTTAIGEKYNGGLGLTHIESFVKSQKISWIKRILGNEKHITVQYLKQFQPEMDLNDFLNCDYDPLMLPYNIPNFYRQDFFAWFEYKSISNVKKILVLAISIWFNRNIVIANKVVWKPIWYSIGIKYISDLLDNDGNFLSCKEFEEKYAYGLPNSFLNYVSIIHAIPRAWREFNSLKVKLKKTTENKLSGKSKKIYQTFKCLYVKQPSCIQAWKIQYNIRFDLNIFYSDEMDWAWH